MIRTFIRDNGVLLLATIAVTPLSLFFSIITARVLGPAQYGILAVMIAIQQVLAQTVGSFSLVTAKYVSAYRATDNQPAIAAFLRSIVRLMIQVGVVSVLVLSVASPFIRSFLHLTSATTVVLVGLLFAGTLGVEVTRGLLQGLHAFGRLALNQIAEAAVRLALGVAILAAGLAINGAIVAYLLGVVAAIALTVPLFRVMTREPGPRPPLGPIIAFSRMVIVVGACNIALTNADLILVKHYFPPTDAGIYAAVAAFGRLLYIASVVVWTTMFPKIVAINAVKGNSARLLLMNIGVLLFFAADAVTILALFGEPLLRGLYGGAYAPGAGLLGLYGLSVLLALPVNSINFYLMARSRTQFVPIYIAGVCLQIGLIVVFHGSLRQVILAMCASNVTMLLSYMLLLGIPHLHARSRLPHQSPATAGNALSNGEGQH